MTVVYESPRARLILGDSRELLQGVATESVDLVIVDPPYGVEWSSGFREDAFGVMDGDGTGDREGVGEILAQCVRVVGQNRHLYVFGPDDVLQGLKVTAPVSLIWAKQVIGAGDLAAPWGPMHEPISFLVSKHRHAGQAGTTNNLAAKLRKGSVLAYPRPTGRKVRHPSEKPVGLISDLIESSSRIGELVLDPCAGSGSTGVAALLRGRRALLFEKNEAYATLAAERLRVADELMDQEGTI